MKNIITVILLLASRLIGSVRVNILARDFGHDLNIARSVLSNCTFDIALQCTLASTFMARWISQVKLSAQIVLNFFFYSWRNSIYDGGIASRFRMLFHSLETPAGF